MKRTKSKRARTNGGNNNKPAAGSRRLGYSASELVDRLSRMYSLAPSKAFQREVAVALRRGVDYGILVKSRQRYRYDPEHSLRASLRTAGAPRRGKRGKRGRADETKETRPRVPRPTVPPPPSIRPQPRILTREPATRIIKH
ncbi:uncharacterized protein LOC131670554 [Phymastichus coffea]|uniref:uncharacterized protein LOC131670554 n=1 Tax=Phymastichus coffea TaxID=108790 RepID=UPI00273CCDFA|nr:uncharacterized protein LOC131670554 [Phymastichus coffea]